MNPWRGIAIVSVVLAAQGAPRGTIAVGDTVRDSLTRHDFVLPAESTYAQQWRLRGREAATGRRLGRPLQRAPHAAAARHRGVSHRSHEPRAPGNGRVHSDRDRGPEARRACPLHAVTPVPVAVLVSGGGTNLQALLDALVRR